MALSLLINPISVSGQQLSSDFAESSTELGVDSPVVVELFTSLACGSCPPAEEFATNVLRDLDGVVPLALHVDYWNNQGWTDRHSDAAFTARQQSYAKAASMPFVFTPQIVIHGEYLIAGHAEDRVHEIIKLIGNKSEMHPTLALDAKQVENGLDVRLLNCASADGNYIVQRVLYSDQINTMSGSGENEGRSWVYSNVVADLLEYKWDGKTEFSIVEERLNIDDKTSIIVMLQKAVRNKGYHGPIVASLRLKNHSNAPINSLRISYSDDYIADCGNALAAE